MTPAETIAAAIEKLESFDRGGADEWWHEVEGPFATVLERAATGTFTYVVARDMDEADAELIVTVHRTIDPVLAILRARLTEISVGFDEGGALDEGVIALARAILGEAS